MTFEGSILNFTSAGLKDHDDILYDFVLNSLCIFTAHKKLVHAFEHLFHLALPKVDNGEQEMRFKMLRPLKALVLLDETIAQPLRPILDRV